MSDTCNSFCEKVSDILGRPMQNSKNIVSQGLISIGIVIYSIMVLEDGKYYHLYNRSNNEEKVFKEDRNYQYFLARYQSLITPYVSTLAYCLMPTHFHFIIKITNNDIISLKKNLSSLLSGYTKALNRMTGRHGSLFQPRTKAKLIDDENYLLTVISYVHQNPIRSNLKHRIEDWKYSSYYELVGDSEALIIQKEFVYQFFLTLDEFKKYSKDMVDTIRGRYWVS